MRLMYQFNWLVIWLIWTMARIALFWNLYIVIISSSLFIEQWTHYHRYLFFSFTNLLNWMQFLSYSTHDMEYKSINDSELPSNWIFFFNLNWFNSQSDRWQKLLQISVGIIRQVLFWFRKHGNLLIHSYIYEVLSMFWKLMFNFIEYLEP